MELRSTGRWKLNLPLLLMWTAALVATFLVLYPLLYLIYGSLRTTLPGDPGSLTFSNYLAVFSSHKIGESILNTLILMASVTALACPAGVLLVWITTRTDMPFRRQFEILNIFPFLLSPYVTGVAWTMLLSPRSGLINKFLVGALGLSQPPFDIFSISGTIWVLFFYYTPYMCLFISAAFKAMDPSMEEVARTCGSSLFRTSWRITVPLATPAILSGAILIFVHVAGMFGVPAALMHPKGDYVLTTTILHFIQVYPQQYGSAAAISMFLMMVSGLGIFIQRRVMAGKSYVTVTGKAYRPRAIKLGKWRYVALGANLLYLFLSIVLPYGALLMVSFLRYWSGEISAEIFTLTNYTEVLVGDEAIVRSIKNSLFVSIIGSFICLLITMLVAYLVNRTKVRGRGFFDYVTTLPVGIPGMVIAVGLLWAWIRSPIMVYGTIWIIMIAFITRYVPYGMRAFSNTLVQLGPELEESARICGSSWFGSFRKILIPLLKPGFLSGWILLFVLFMRELSTALVLWYSGNEVISVQLYQLVRDGELSVVAALSIVDALIMITGIIAFRLIFKEDISAGLKG